MCISLGSTALNMKDGQYCNIVTMITTTLQVQDRYDWVRSPDSTLTGHQYWAQG